MEKVQAAFPTMVPVAKGRWQGPRPQKDRLQVVLKECKAELTALCEQYCAKKGWRPPSGVVYKKVHKPARRKVDHPSTRIWDADDLSSGDESHSEGPPMSSRSLRESLSIVDGLPYECKFNFFNSFSSSSEILPITFIPECVFLFMVFWLPPLLPIYQLTFLLFSYVFCLTLCSCSCSYSTFVYHKPSEGIS